MHCVSIACLAGTWPITWVEPGRHSLCWRGVEENHNSLIRLWQETEWLPNAYLTHSQQIVQILTLAAWLIETSLVLCRRMICVEGNEISCLISCQFIKNYIGYVNGKGGRSTSKFRVHNEKLSLHCMSLMLSPGKVILSPVVFCTELQWYVLLEFVLVSTED